MLFGILPEDAKEKVSIRRREPRFHYDEKAKALYRKSYDGVLLRCLSDTEAEEVLRQTHNGVCGQPGPKPQDRIRRLGYYWPTMIQDSMEY